MTLAAKNRQILPVDGGLKRYIFIQMLVTRKPVLRDCARVRSKFLSFDLNIKQRIKTKLVVGYSVTLAAGKRLLSTRQMLGGHAGPWCRIVGAVPVLCFCAVLLLGCVNTPNNQPESPMVSSEFDLAHPVNRCRTMEVTILVPADRQKYDEMIDTGGGEAAAALPFVSKKVRVPYSSDVIRATAEAAARESGDQAGEGVRYLKIQDGTAYVLLPMDCDGWAGVGIARAASHPIVKRSLLQFKNIEHVVWDVVPGENLHNVCK